MSQQSKIGKYFKRVLIGLVVLPIMIVAIPTMIISFSPVQRVVCNYASNIASNNLGVNVMLSGFMINLFSQTISLNGVYLEDQQGDTLAYIGSLSLKLDKFNIDNNSYNFARIELDTLTARIKADSLGVFNYEFLLSDSNDSDTIAEDSSMPLDLIISRLNIKNVNATYSVCSDSIESHLMNYDNIIVSDMALNASKIHFMGKNTALTGKIHLLTAKEHCGFQLDRLALNVDFSENGLFLSDLVLQCPATSFYSDSIRLKYNGFDDFSYFIDSVFIDATISEGSMVGLNDVGHFVDGIYGFDISPILELKASGKVNNLRVDKIDIRYGSETHFNAKFWVQGLPDVNNLAFDCNINEFSTNAGDILAVGTNNDNETVIDIPEFVDKIGTLNLSCNALGTSNNCKMNCNLESKLGNVITNIDFHKEQEKGILTGTVEAEALNLGAITQDSTTLGLLSTHDSINVIFSDNGKIHGHILGEVDSVGLLGYYYHNIKMNGEFSETSFDGKLSVKDSCLNLDFNGEVQFGSLYKGCFEFNLNHADLATTNILGDSIDVLKFSVLTDISAHNLDDINGVILLSKPLEFTRNDQKIRLNNFKLQQVVDNYVCGFPENKAIIYSDFVDAQIVGRIRSSQFFDIISSFVYMVIPSLNYNNQNIFKREPITANYLSQLDKNSEEFKNFLGSKFDFNIAFKNMNTITNFFVPELYISNNTIIEGGFNTLKGNSWVTFKTDKLSFDTYAVDSMRLSAKLDKDTFNLKLNCDSIILSDDMKLKLPKLELSGQNDTIGYSFQWNNSDSITKQEGFVLGEFAFCPHYLENHFPILNVRFYETNFWTWNKQWTISDSKIVIDSTSVNISDFFLKCNNQFFRANGIISNNKDDHFSLELNEFDLSLLNNFIGNNTLAGHSTGKITVSNLYGSLPLIELQNKIDTLVINDVKIGPFNADFDFQPNDSLVHIDFYAISKMGKKNLHGNGIFDIKNQEMDFSFDIGNLSSKVLRPLFQNYLTVPSTQFLDGITHIKGKLDNPQITSDLKLKGGYFKIDYLGTKYTIQDALHITVDNNLICLDKVKLLSGQTGLAYLEGTINHQNFNNFKMAINLQLKNFTLLNAKQTDSSAFWGKAFASGNVKITGDPTHLINIDAKVKTDKNTQIFLPLYGASEVNNDFNFITFKNSKDTVDTEIHRQQADLSDIRMNFNLEVTPDAEVQAILDETTGNILKASASGNLKLDISGSGDFNMYGTLAVEKGDYLFTMSNVLSKKFEVVKGGTLRWNGDPMDAIVDLSAMYRIRKVNLYNLMVDEQYRDKKVPVQCLLKMKGNLMTPEISFGVTVSENGGVVQGQIDNLDEANINKQMISLLLLNQFQPLPGLRSSENSMMFSEINAGEIVTNKINSILSDISDKFDVGVNYQMGDASTADELDVAVSTQFFDERITVSTNLGVSGDSKNQTNNNTNNIVGEVEVEAKLNKSGSMKLNVYNKANEDELQETPYKQGIGFSYKKEFDSFKDLWQSVTQMFGRKPKN